MTAVLRKLIQTITGYHNIAPLATHNHVNPSPEMTHRSVNIDKDNALVTGVIKKQSITFVVSLKMAICPALVVGRKKFANVKQLLTAKQTETVTSLLVQQ